MALVRASARHLRASARPLWPGSIQSSRISVGQHGVELALGRDAVLGPDRLEAVVAQVDRDQLGDGGLVFDDQDAGQVLHDIVSTLSERPTRSASIEVCRTSAPLTT